jgi:hypothetical protein
MQGIADTVPSALKSTAAPIEGSTLPPYRRTDTHDLPHVRLHIITGASIYAASVLMFPIGSSFDAVPYRSAVGIIALLCMPNLQQCIVQLRQAFHPLLLLLSALLLFHCCT